MGKEEEEGQRKRVRRVLRLTELLGPPGSILPTLRPRVVIPSWRTT